MADNETDAQCGIYSCPRNMVGLCELTIKHLKDKRHTNYTEPGVCTHRKFVLRNKEEN